jgi:hypothetical protein
MRIKKFEKRAAHRQAGLVLAGLVWLGLSSAVMIGAPQQQAATSSAAAPTFSADVAPIMYAKCVACHRPGEVAPMSLITYKDVRPWASSIREKVMSRVMPPWHADRQYGTFRNEQSLTQAEIDTIVKWASAGAPEGNPSRLPALPKFPDGWQIGTPDIVFEMPVAYNIPASGTIAYQYFEVPTNFTEDKWVQAGEVRAGDRKHVHHVIVSVREPQPIPRPNVVSIRPIPATAPGAASPAASPGAATPNAAAPAAPAPRPAPRVATAGGGNARSAGDATLVNWAVGEDAPVFQPGMGKRVPKGATLIFQVHYTTDGTPGTDRSKVGLIFSKETPQREVRTGMIANPMFAIPPGVSDYQIDAEATFSEDVNVWSMHPHMHYRGKDMTYTAIYPDGRREIVLRVPKFDFGWQTDYWLAKPLSLPKGSKLYVSAHYDNSAANRNNPDPTATVRWGDQTWEEMMIGYFTYTVEGKSGGVSSSAQ